MVTLIDVKIVCYNYKVDSVYFNCPVVMEIVPLANCKTLMVIIGVVVQVLIQHNNDY